MSDNFIPLTQSTPVQQRQRENNQPQMYVSKRVLAMKRNQKLNSHCSKWEKSTRSSYGSNSSNNSSSHDRRGIDAYLHPSMLQDPWEILRLKQQNNSISKMST